MDDPQLEGVLRQLAVQTDALNDRLTHVTKELSGIRKALEGKPQEPEPKPARKRGRPRGT